MAIGLLFDFDQLGQKNETGLKEIKRIFKKNGIRVVSSDVSKLKRSSGVSFKELGITCDDSQRVIFMIKQTGDIFRVKVNNKELPIKNQEDIEKAILEVANKLDSGRAAFQKRLTRIKVNLPPKIKSTVITVEKALVESEKQLDTEIDKANKKKMELLKQLGR